MDSTKQKGDVKEMKNKTVYVTRYVYDDGNSLIGIYTTMRGAEEGAKKYSDVWGDGSIKWKEGLPNDGFTKLFSEHCFVEDGNFYVVQEIELDTFLLA